MGHLGVGDLVVWLVLTAAVFVGVPVAIFVFARRLLRTVERRPVREGQRFTNELLLERSRETQSPPPGAT